MAKKHDEKLLDILSEPMNEEVLERMPEWFRQLRKAYQNRTVVSESNSSMGEQNEWLNEDEFTRAIKILIKHLR